MSSIQVCDACGKRQSEDDDPAWACILLEVEHKRDKVADACCDRCIAQVLRNWANVYDPVDRSDVVRHIHRAGPYR